MKRISCIVVLVLLVAGCATTETETFSKDPLVRPGSRIELGAVSVAPGKTYEIDTVELMRTALQEALAEREIAWQGEEGVDRFILNVQIDDYEPGNAFKRWLMPGYGSTVMHVSGGLVDVATGETAGELDYERGVHWGGAYTIGAWEKIFKDVADDIATELEHRINSKGFVVRLRAWAGRELEIPVAEPRQKFEITTVTDSRPERGRIGERTALNVSMGDVFFYPQVPSFIKNAVASELVGEGHELVVDGTGRPVSLEITEFWTHTDTTIMYWDIVGNMTVAVTVGADGAEQKQQTFRCETTERTYLNPSLDLVSKVMDECLVELIQGMRDAPVWAPNP